MVFMLYCKNNIYIFLRILIKKTITCKLVNLFEEIKKLLFTQIELLIYGIELHLKPLLKNIVFIKVRIIK